LQRRQGEPERRRRSRRRAEAAEFATAKSKTLRPCAVKQTGFPLGQVSRWRSR